MKFFRIHGYKCLFLPLSLKQLSYLRCSRNIITCLKYVVVIIAADVLVMQGDRASGAMELFQVHDNSLFHFELISINSLAPGKFEWNFIFRYVIFKPIFVIDGWGISLEIALIWMSLDFTNDQSILVQVMAWCCQATSHCLSQCWPRSVSPYGVVRPEWVNSHGGWLCIPK